MEPLLDLELLRTFSAVVQAGELKKAATSVYRSQAAVSMQLKRLESQLGSCLMERSNQGIKLTEAGETLLSYTEQFFKLNAATLSAITKPELSGKIRFGIPTDYAQDFLHSFMPVLARELPNLDARVVCDRSRNLRKQVRLGELDLAIVAGEPDIPDELPLWTERLIWVAPLSTQFEERETLPVALLADNCIVRDLSIKDLKQAGIPHEQVFSSPVLENVAAAVHAGFAVSLLPDSLISPSRTRPLSGAISSSPRLLQMNMIASPMIDDRIANRLAQCMKAAASQLRYRHKD
jgi:DNA-binding transcriptional LysR family regulator